MKRFRKADIQRHTDGGYGTFYPAVNVKVYHFPTVEQVQAEWPDVDEKTAEKALEFAYESSCEIFWEYWQDKAGDVENGLYGSPEYSYFPGYNNRLMVYSAGRSGGWLIVQGLPPVEEWDAVMVAR